MAWESFHLDFVPLFLVPSVSVLVYLCETMSVSCAYIFVVCLFWGLRLEVELLVEERQEKLNVPRYLIHPHSPVMF